MDKALRTELVEALAEVEHRQWLKWAESVQGEVSEERRARWVTYMVPYDQLDEATKDLDREWAEEALAAIEPILKDTSGGPVKEMITKVEVDSDTYPSLSQALGRVAVEAKAKRKGKRAKASKKSSKSKADKKAFAKKMKDKKVKASPEHSVKYAGMSKAKFPSLSKVLADVGGAGVDPHLNDYLTCALWSSMDNADESGGEPLDANYGVEDLSPEAMDQAKRDWAAFQEQAGPLLDGLDLGQVAHDFWLTRNGHGAGFWDGDYEEAIGEKLTELSKKFGEVDLYIGDDHKLHMSGGKIPAAEGAVESAKKSWKIYDWAGNLKFDGKAFDSAEDAEGFLSEKLGDQYETDREEYEISQKESRPSNYLDPKDPRAGQKST
jgi:hypothetical protein